MRTLSNHRRFRLCSLPACLIACLLTVAPAAATPIELTRQQKTIQAGGLNAFARENLPSFTLASLDNGIPVVIKKNTTNRILTLKAVMLGHVSLTPVEKAGLEAVTLRMLTRGSARYPYPEFQRILFEKSSSIAPSFASFDSSSFDLVTIDTYFDELFSVYADAFLHPAWNAEEFPRVMNDFKVSKQEAENDPWQRTVRLLHEEFFHGHPYAAAWDGTGGSLESITLDDVKSYYERSVTSGRMILVAVGNFEPAKLVRMLNATFGALPRRDFVRPPVPSLQGAVRPDLVVEPFDEAEGTAYVRGDFALPSPDSPDYPAVLVAFNLLDDLLFEIVRTQHGACYSVWSTVHGFTASYGDITVYQTSVPGKVKQYVDEAIAVLLPGPVPGRQGLRIRGGEERDRQGNRGEGAEGRVRAHRGGPALLQAAVHHALLLRPADEHLRGVADRLLDRVQWRLQGLPAHDGQARGGDGGGRAAGCPRLAEGQPHALDRPGGHARAQGREEGRFHRPRRPVTRQTGRTSWFTRSTR